MISTAIRPYVEPGLRQLRRLWLPFAIIQLVGLVIVISYFASPAVERAFGVLTDVRDRGGIPFTAVALAFACGVVPELFKTVTGVDRTFTSGRLGFMMHNVAVFGLIGVVQAFFYDFLGRTLGDTRAPHIVLAKTSIDMLLYSPLFSVPLICFSFTLRSHAYRMGPSIQMLGPRWYLREVVPVLVVNMAYWWPMGLLMYTLPPKMTFIYGTIGSAASATLLTAVASRDAELNARGIDPRGK